MARRILLCIGCDNYGSLGRLKGAEADACNVHSELTTSRLSCIDGFHSRLLLSPTRDEVLSSLESLQDSDEEVESFTLFFAGHGGLSQGTYYLCFADTREQRLATTGFSLSHLFEFINELHPAHCNLILDACHAAGLVSDLGALLKPELIGKRNTAGVSIFATSAADQYAGDTLTGGTGTIALLKVLRGEIDTGSRSPFLDLLDIGRAAANQVNRDTGGNQSPSYWGMNLYGSMPIFGNPHASSEKHASLYSITGISPASEAGALISEHASALLGLLYISTPDLGAKKLFDVLSPRMAELARIPGACASFIDGVHRALYDRFSTQENSFAVVELSGACLALLLPTICVDPASEEQAYRLSFSLVVDVKSALKELIGELEKKPSCLCRNGLVDLYFLPQRIARILGWSEAAIYISELLDAADAELQELLAKTYSIVLPTYAANLGGMSEAEAPFWFICLVNARRRDDFVIGEQILGTLFNALVENGGGLAKSNLNSDNAIPYLMARAKKDVKDGEEFVAHPTEILSMTLLLGAIFSLQDIFDEHLQRLDHKSINIFLPNTHTEFSFPQISNGRNHLFQIGHGIWRVSDLVSRWSAACVPQLEADASLHISAVKIAALCSALVFPDRVPWFLLEPKECADWWNAIS